MTLDWYYSDRIQTYLAGSPSSGCGVYSDKGLWYGNIVHGQMIQLTIGPYDTKEKAQSRCEAEWYRAVNSGLYE